MESSEKEANLKWIFANHGSVKLEKIVERIEKILGIELDNEEYDLEAELVRYLNRDLTPTEVFHLRPVLMDVYSNYYGEE